MADRVYWKEQSEQDPVLCNYIHIQKVKSDFFKTNMPAHKDVNINYYNQKRLKLLELTQTNEKSNAKTYEK